VDVYENTDGGSGVVAYEIGDDSITVQFRGGSLYLYDDQSAGSHNIERMKDLAREGSGLNSFINSVVKYKYAAKLR